MTVAAPVDRVFRALVAWDRQGEWIPLTRVRIVEGDGGEGTIVESITSLGPAEFRDEFRVDRLDPPYEIRVEHVGPFLHGPGVLRCTPLAGERTHVVWHEWFQLPGGTAGQLAWPVLWPGTKISLNIALRRFARLVETAQLS